MCSTVDADKGITPSLLGMDVGFSATRKTTGLAWRIDAQIGVEAVGTTWQSRKTVIPEDVRFELASVDAPILPSPGGVQRRACEAILYRRPFWNRCRPGLSHHGRGLNLRNAGADAATQIASLLSPAEFDGPQVTPGLAVVEAFPNAFLGLMLPEGIYAGVSKPARRSKSDWLYERALEHGALARVLQHLGWNDSETLGLLENETHHEKRAALVCLLTAGVAQIGTATIIGDSVGGWLWLPPRALWANWALRGLEESIRRCQQRGFPKACVWSGCAA